MFTAGASQTALWQQTNRTFFTTDSTATQRWPDRSDERVQNPQHAHMHPPSHRQRTGTIDRVNGAEVGSWTVSCNERHFNETPAQLQVSRHPQDYHDSAEERLLVFWAFASGGGDSINSCSFPEQAALCGSPSRLQAFSRPRSDNLLLFPFDLRINSDHRLSCATFAAVTRSSSLFNLHKIDGILAEDSVNSSSFGSQQEMHRPMYHYQPVMRQENEPAFLNLLQMTFSCSADLSTFYSTRLLWNTDTQQRDEGVSVFGLGGSGLCEVRKVLTAALCHRSKSWCIPSHAPDKLQERLAASKNTIHRLFVCLQHPGNNHVILITCSTYIHTYMYVLGLGIDYNLLNRFNYDIF